MLSNFFKLNPISPVSGLSNEILCILAAQDYNRYIIVIILGGYYHFSSRLWNDYNRADLQKNKTKTLVSAREVMAERV